MKFDSVDIVSKPLEYKFVVVKAGEYVDQHLLDACSPDRNATAEWESIPNRVLYVSRDYPGPIRAQWNVEQRVDPKYLELQAERKKTWLAQAEKLRALREADPDKNAPVANKVQKYRRATLANVLNPG